MHIWRVYPETGVTIAGVSWHSEPNELLFMGNNIYINCVAIDLELRQYVLASNAGLILRLHPANERRRYFVTTSLIGWAQA